MSAASLAHRGEEALRAWGTAHHLDLIARRASLEWHERHDDPTIAFIGIPLTMVAVALLGKWWMWIPLVAMSAAVMPSWNISALLTLQMGFVGAEWAVAGTSYLIQFPGESFAIGLGWIAFPAALAAAGHLNQRRNSYAAPSSSGAKAGV